MMKGRTSAKESPAAVKTKKKQGIKLYEEQKTATKSKETLIQ